MRITTLGSLALDGRPVRGERLATIVRELIAARGRAVSVGALVDAVWDDEPPEDATGAVQALVSRTRRLGLPVHAVPGGYRVPFDDPALDLRVDEVDARAGVEQARRSLRAGDPAGALSAAQAARALLPAVPGDDAATTARLLGDVAELRALAQLALGGPYDETDLRVLATRTPPDEPAAALLVRVLAAQGRDAEALEVVEHLRGELAERYGTDPSPVVAQAHLALLRGELGPRPGDGQGDGQRDEQVVEQVSAPAPQPVPANPPDPSVAPRRPTPPLPPSWRRPPTSLVGREDDVGAVLDALRHAPAVTIVATGGAGKTRLAVEVVHRLALEGRPAVVVELAGLRTPDEVLPAVVGALGGAETAANRPELVPVRRVLSVSERLGAAVQDLEGVVVLDNCEHVLAAAAEVVAELVAVVGPDVAVLATSRAALGVVGEEVHLLRALPDDDALDLLEARARAGRPGLAWDPDAARELCHRLDNLPLALELAAARLRTMPVTDVLAGLDNRFKLLDSALRGLPERHASLWTLVDWSRDLLDDDERDLLQRLAVFPAPFTAPAAAAVAGRPEAAVRLGLAILVDQSLLTLDDSGTVARYRMLETVREYGDARLDTAGDRAASMDALTRWAATESLRLEAHFVGPDQIEAFATCSDEQETFVAALRWALEHDDEAAAIDVAVALFHSWSVRGLHIEVIAWSERVLAAHDPAARRRSALYRGSTGPRPLPNANSAAYVALFAAINGGVASALRLAVLAMRVLRRIESERPDEVSPRVREIVAALPHLSLLDDRLSEEAADRMTRSADAYVRALGLFLRAAVRENGGNPGSSAEDARAAYRVFEEVGDHWGMGMAAQGVAQWSASRGDPGAAEWVRRGVHHLELVGAVQDARSLRVLLDVQQALLGEPDAIEALRELVAGQGDPLDAIQALIGLGRVALRDGDTELARADAREAAARASHERQAVPQARVVYAVAACGLLLQASVDESADVRAATDAEVRNLLIGARADVEGMSDMPVVGSWALGGAELAASRGDVPAATELWALGLRFGANLAALSFELGAVPSLGDTLVDATERVAELRSLTVAEVSALIQAGMAELLGTDVGR
ncbi:AfsR/SARP family transcriptional regulator [Cellulomonas composti]|uniref:SARP family transcriptional regulator n=1 Tax=Cellulomonas composti TaxID=266130 RepID=A0A511J7P5_9CELL|nr:BTAD domain-containing putative transcriptional regulator [Cellulomonas composti]GEL94017.1 hypothetical protein CCO02nite_06750 [Cellulomonas composti]